MLLDAGRRGPRRGHVDAAVARRRRPARAGRRGDEPASDVVERLLALLHERARLGAELVVFPELALTTFFPRWFVEDQAEIDALLRDGDAVGRHQAAVRRGRRASASASASATPSCTAATVRHHYNTQMLVERDGHGRRHATARCTCPATRSTSPGGPFQHLERRYFEPGPDGFGVWRAFGGIVGMTICNDRRWPETYRVMGLQGVELILSATTRRSTTRPTRARTSSQGFHNQLVMQAGAYQNGTWVVGVAKGGVEEGVDSLAQSAIIAPVGRDRRPGCSTTGDELVVADCDLDRCAQLQGHAVRLRPLPDARALRTLIAEPEQSKDRAR